MTAEYLFFFFPPFITVRNVYASTSDSRTKMLSEEVNFNFWESTFPVAVYNFFTCSVKICFHDLRSSSVATWLADTKLAQLSHLLEESFQSPLCSVDFVLTLHMPLYILPFLLLRLAVIISEMGLGYNCWTSLSAGNNMDCCRSVFSQCNLSISQILLSDPARLKHRIQCRLSSWRWPCKIPALPCWLSKILVLLGIQITHFSFKGAWKLNLTAWNTVEAQDLEYRQHMWICSSSIYHQFAFLFYFTPLWENVTIKNIFYFLNTVCFLAVTRTNTVGGKHRISFQIFKNIPVCRTLISSWLQLKMCPTPHRCQHTKFS